MRKEHTESPPVPFPQAQLRNAWSSKCGPLSCGRENKMEENGNAPIVMTWAECHRKAYTEDTEDASHTLCGRR